MSAVAIWTIQQKWVQDATPASERSIATPATQTKGSLVGLFSDDDYPPDAVAKGEEGTVQADLAVDKRGRVTQCTILKSAGETLDRATCQALQRRARFTPALGSPGKPVPD